VTSEFHAVGPVTENACSPNFVKVDEAVLEEVYCRWTSIDLYGEMMWQLYGQCHLCDLDRGEQ